MGRFTAYDQDGRMVADFDKSEHDFLCRYGRTPEEVLDENAKLREELDAVGVAAYLYGKEQLESENAKLRKENDTLCRRIDELCMENEQLRNQHTAKARRIVVSNHDTDCATGHSECSACGAHVSPTARWCESCGAKFMDKEDE